jgi:hypothetical protein
MDKRARLDLDALAAALPAGLFETGELDDDELEMAVGGLDRAWTPAVAGEAATRTTVPA